jgi:hypothetical protein
MFIKVLNRSNISYEPVALIIGVEYEVPPKRRYPTCQVTLRHVSDDRNDRTFAGYTYILIDRHFSE